ncbi:MaoC family dehydratase N-terminal domain-containing protein [Algiphilus sp. W345]|uniref:MaoC family dehydratase N-terminal domain-containing protein n=1 Tax=Banduia mediterranea TaxID=3075609 RepID=A0ABU2WEU4_9GAMM|nr:MaoC family dehydratase N-terminal domain-containing protein [Algiphilus sp. W345]MDT0496385.1 MaoC family dehydratase N-terminal domain-containing protein [Algiphilus sp. W345]
MRTIGIGLHFEDLPVGERFRTCARTLTEADLVAFIGFSWLTEEVFTNLEHRQGMALPPRVVPGAMVYAVAEGLLTPAMQGTGLAFLHAALDVRAPACVGDTLHVEAQVIESRLTSKGDRGLVRTENRVLNQRGETILIYTPLRLLRRRGTAVQPQGQEPPT